MKKQKGIWIDTKQAVIVSLDGNDHTVNTISSGIETRLRIPGEKKWFSRFGSQFLNFDKKKENRRENEVRVYLKLVADAIKPTINAGGQVTELVLFGPAGMKKELEKIIRDEAIPAIRLMGVETTDIMTENQMVAWVKQYFKK